MTFFAFEQNANSELTEILGNIFKENTDDTVT